MAHTTMVNGTIYEKSKGKDLVGGTVYEKDHGKTLVGGTVCEIAFNTDVFVELGTFTATLMGQYYSIGFKFDNLPFDDMSLCNALMVNGELYRVNYILGQIGSPNTGSYPCHRYEIDGFNGLNFSESIPYALQFNMDGSNVAIFRAYREGTYTVSLGISSQFS